MSKLKHFIVTVDTEADNQWSHPGNLSCKNIVHLPRFHRLVREHGFLPTYLVTHEVATDGPSMEIINRLVAGGGEVGAHLHPWSNPPYERAIEWERTYHRFPNELDPGELRDKLLTLTKAIETSFGARPTSFRAGRWGFGPAMVAALRDFGYRVDSSVTPGLSWRRTIGDPVGAGGPDFRHASFRPYELSLTNVCQSGTSGVIEIPMTVLPVGGVLERTTRRLLSRPRWFRIFPETTLDDLIEVYRAANYYQLPYIQFMIHSSELMAGSSPYVKTEAALERLYDKLVAVLKFFSTDGLRGVTLKGAAPLFQNDWCQDK